MKTKLGTKTYCYKNFITDKQQQFLIDWSLSHKSKFKANTTGPDKYLGRLHELGVELPELFKILKEKIVKLEKIEKSINVPHNVDWIGIQGNGAQVFPHLDDNGEDSRYYTRRYNILLSLPEEGGNPIYGGEILNVEEKMMWRCDAGLVEHSSLPNKGEKLRINLSFGFLIPKEKIFNKSLL